MKIAFVCNVNVVRSPAFEAAFNHISHREGTENELVALSFGLHQGAGGSRPDPNMVQAAQTWGVVIDHSSQPFDFQSTYDECDLILAINQRIVDVLKGRAPNESAGEKVHLVTYQSKLYPDEEIPDPYGVAVNPEVGFGKLFNEIYDICEELYTSLKPQLGP
ncbi:MAG: putative low molecular weight protein-tyrosine-phosphatase [Chlamydiia bacterium]|nr:putative low molecular weight protein-tyrosine-phosphatase [Chlamydiia bacterium]